MLVQYVFVEKNNMLQNKYQIEFKSMEYIELYAAHLKSMYIILEIIHALPYASIYECTTQCIEKQCVEIIHTSMDRWKYV